MAQVWIGRRRERERQRRRSGAHLAVRQFCHPVRRPDLRFENRKAKALIGYLLLSGDLRESRERLVGLLWSETDEQRARASLRQTLFQLREIFSEAGFEGFVSDKLSVGFQPGSVDVDVAEALSMARQGVPAPLPA